MLRLGTGAPEFLDPGWMPRTGWRITTCVLKQVKGYSRAPVHAFDGDGCAVVVGGQRQLGAVCRTHARDGGEE